MAEPAPATEQNETRRIEMLRAAAELICERGFGDTRDRLLVDALRYSEESFY